VALQGSGSGFAQACSEDKNNDDPSIKAPLTTPHHTTTRPVTAYEIIDWALTNLSSQPGGL